MPSGVFGASVRIKKSHGRFFFFAPRVPECLMRHTTSPGNVRSKKKKKTPSRVFFFPARAPGRFEILGGSRDLLVVFGASRCWRVERLQNSGRKWLPSRCLRRVGTLTRGASSKFWAQVATLSLFLTRRDAGAWSVFEIQGVSGHPLVVFGAS